MEFHFKPTRVEMKKVNPLLVGYRHVRAIKSGMVMQTGHMLLFADTMLRTCHMLK